MIEADSLYYHLITSEYFIVVHFLNLWIQNFYQLFNVTHRYVYIFNRLSLDAIQPK